MVFQDYALYPHMDMSRRNMSFALRLATAGRRAEIKTTVVLRVATMLLHIDHLLDRKPAELSGGQRQRVAMGRAHGARCRHVSCSMNRSRTSTPSFVPSMRTELAEMRDTRCDKNMIYVTHDQVEAMTLGDRIVVMQGRRYPATGFAGRSCSNVTGQPVRRRISSVQPDR